MSITYIDFFPLWIILIVISEYAEEHRIIQNNTAFILEMEEKNEKEHSTFFYLDQLSVYFL